jgi:hypothetical protein
MPRLAALFTPAAEALFTLDSASDFQYNLITYA